MTRSPWKIAPALAAGCTIVHKPAELSPLTAKILVEIAESAGLPKGVWNTINGYGEEAGKLITEHSEIKAISFVGESATGSMIMKQGSDTLKRVHFELGGKNAVVVFEDADLERAADAVVFMIYSLNGERCTSSSRLLVEESVREKFVQMILEKAKRIKIGHPLDPDTIMGPLIHPIHDLLSHRRVEQLPIFHVRVQRVPFFRPPPPAVVGKRPVGVLRQRRRRASRRRRRRLRRKPLSRVFCLLHCLLLHLLRVVEIVVLSFLVVIFR